MGYLLSEDNNSFVVILAENENLQLAGDKFSLSETIVIKNGKQNKLFEQYAIEHPRREQTLSAWDYLTKIYRKDSLFAIHEVPKQAIAKEKQRIKAQDSLFLASLPKDYHVFATPTIYLLDNKREILLRPNSVSQLDSWVDWYLVQGNT
jgi:hypothetical protein